nr:hypothetical protein [Clostridium yunnanense]
MNELEYCSIEFREGISFLEVCLQEEIDKFQLSNDIDLLAYTCEFYVMFKIGHTIADKFISILKEIDLDSDWLFDDPHNLYYLHKMGVGDSDNYKEAFEIYIKNEQRRSGYILCNQYNHVGPMRALVQYEHDSDYATLAIKYFINNYNREDWKNNSIGILTLFEYDYNKYKDLILAYIIDLKEVLQHYPYKNEEYASLYVIYVSFAVQAISCVCGNDDPFIKEAIEWIKENHYFEGYYGKRIVGESMLALISVGEGIKVPKEEIETLHLLHRQEIKKLENRISSNNPNGIVNYENRNISVLEEVLSRFHIFANQLKKRYNSRNTIQINDEYDVQDLLHSVIKMFYDDIRPEEWTPSYAGKSSRVDFLLKKEEIVIEVKKTRPSLGAKEIGDQLIIDISRYKVHPNCKILYCFVYDPDYLINNPVGLEADLSSVDNDFSVIVKVVPKGL